MRSRPMSRPARGAIASRAARAKRRRDRIDTACAPTASSRHPPDGPARPRQTSRSRAGRYACAMSDLDDALAVIDTWGAGHAAAAVIGPGGVVATRGDPDTCLPLGVGHEARDRVDRADRRRPRARSARRRGRTAGLDRPPPPGPRVGTARSKARRRSRRPGRAGSTRTRGSTRSARTSRRGPDGRSRR